MLHQTPGLRYRVSGAIDQDERLWRHGSLLLARDPSSSNRRLGRRSQTSAFETGPVSNGGIEPTS